MKIVILPGLDGTGTLLLEIVELLSLKHRVDVLRYPTNLHRYDDLQKWIEANLPPDDFIIVAESFSGPLAIMIAAKSPPCLKGVVFAASFAKAPRKVPAFLTYAITILPIKSRLLCWLAQPLLMGKWRTKEITNLFRQTLAIVPASTIAKRLREVLKVDVAGLIGRLEIPIIYLLATGDRLVPSRMSHDFQRAPDNVYTIEGPHFLLQANAQASAKYINDFASIVR